MSLISTTPTKSSTTPTHQPLSSTLPPLIFGTATLNYQFNLDPYALHPNTLVSSALASGIRAFDTSPYYGPAEEILGTALHSTEVTTHPQLHNLTRSQYFLLTKAGRISSDTFDYSPAWIRHSVQRSLKRLHTTYLDVVYLHDVEFVSPAEVLSAIRTLRSIRDAPARQIRHVGICGYPVDVLASLAEMILRETGESLDIVQSYANFTVQNQRLRSEGLNRFVEAGVDVVANASPLGMGLLRRQGVPVGAMGNWHPAEDGLREACLRAAEYVDGRYAERLEVVAVRFAMESWMEVGNGVGSMGLVPSEAVAQIAGEDEARERSEESRPRLGVNVMGVSKLSELADTMVVYNSIIAAGSESEDSRKTQIRDIAAEIRREILGSEWTDHAWSSPDPGFVNKRVNFGVSEEERREYERIYSSDDGESREEKLTEAVRQSNGLEKSVTANVEVVDLGSLVSGDEKVRELEVNIEETIKEMTPPRE